MDDNDTLNSKLQVLFADVMDGAAHPNAEEQKPAPHWQMFLPPPPPRWRNGAPKLALWERSSSKEPLKDRFGQTVFQWKVELKMGARGERASQTSPNLKSNGGYRGAKQTESTGERHRKERNM